MAWPPYIRAPAWVPRNPWPSGQWLPDCGGAREKWGFAVSHETGRLWRGAALALVAPLALTSVAGGGGRVPAARHGGAAVLPHGRMAGGVISTVAGGVGGPGPGRTVALHQPCGVSFAARRVYVADDTVVRVVSPQTGRLTTPAGTGAVSPLGDGGPAAGAGLGTCGVAVDHAGNLVIADDSDSRIRVVAAATARFYGEAMTAGHIYTVAGTGAIGFSGDGGPAALAGLAGPEDVAVDGPGDLLIADTANDRIREVTP